MKSTRIENTLYLMGGCDHTGSTKAVQKADLNKLIAKAKVEDQTTTGPPLWQVITDTPLELSAPLSFRGFLLAVGGRTSNASCEPSSSILLYLPDTERWVRVGDITHVAYNCTCSVLPSTDKIVVAGGQIDSRCCLDTACYLAMH